MQLSREAIQRMIDGAGMNVGISGGGGSGAGGASIEWVNSNFVSIGFFNRLFSIHGEQTVIDEQTEEETTEEVNVLPNDVETTIKNIEAKFGFWSQSFISALGLNSSGGGGGATALSQLTDVQLANPADGEALLYDANTGKWKNGTVGGGGGGSGTVERVAMTVPIGFSISGSPITSSGTLALSFASGYSLPTTAKQTNWDTAYGWGNHANAGYAMASALSSYLPLSGGAMTNTNLVTNMNADLLDGRHVVTQGGVSSSGVYGDRIPFITSSYVMEIGRYIDFHTSDGVGDFTTRLKLHESSGSVDANANTIMLPSGSGTLALTTDTVASANRLSGTGTYTAWGQQYWANGVPNTISGNMTSVGSITMSGNINMDNNGTILVKDSSSNLCSVLTFNSYNNLAIGYGTRLRGYVTDIQGGKINFAVNNGVTDTDSKVNAMEITTTGRVWVKQSTQGLRIGDGLITWDSTNNALKVAKYDGTAAHLYSLGGLSALGFSSGSGGSDSATIGTLTSTNATVTTKLSVGNANNYLTLHNSSSGGLKLTGSDGVHIGSYLSTDGNNFYVNGGKIYLSSTVYLITNGSDVQVVINGTTYKLQKTTA